MEPVAQVSLEDAWRNEKKWFKRTLYAGLCSFLALAGNTGASFWVMRRVSALAATTGKDFQVLMDGLLFYQLIAVSAGIVLIVSGLVFLFSLFRWLFAIRARRKCLVEAGDLFSR